MDYLQYKSEDPVTLFHDGDIAVISINNPPVNALSQVVREGLVECIERATTDNSVTCIVIKCDGRTFIAGADISEFGHPPLEPHLPYVLEKIDNCTKPIVAALFGTVLGGGFELALSCHYRVAVSGTKLGLPEVTLGLIPGAGGTQLLPRIGGIELALDMITSGKPKSVQSLCDTGVIDLIVDDSSELIERTIEFSRNLRIQENTLRRTSKIVIENNQKHAQLFSLWRSKAAKKLRGQQAPQYAIDSIENALLLPFAQAMQEERRLFNECRISTQSQALRHAFVAERMAAKRTKYEDEAPALVINSVAVIGAGTMGVGIAMCFAQAGIAVVLLDMKEESVAKGLIAIESRFSQAVKRGVISGAQLTEAMARITGTCEYRDVGNVDLVVEAAFESMEVKKQIFSTLDEVCKPETIFTSNTSYLDINEIAQSTHRAHKVLGMHFFSPANIMKLLEVVRADKTDQQSLKTVMALGKQIGKVCVAVGVCYGYVGNRMYACYGREANALLLEGATPGQIDRALQQWGMAMGPLAVNDMSGIDIGYKARQENGGYSNDPHYFRAADLMVEANRLGQKTAAGFYRYDKDSGSRIEDVEVLTLLSAEADRLGVVQRSDITDEEIQYRLIFALINEGAYILEEGIVARASDIDVIWLNGYGFPRYLGGPMFYADEFGLAELVTMIKGFKQLTGKVHWDVAPILERLVETSEKLALQ